MITAVILNYKRPQNLIKHIIPKLSNYNLINEIIISHGNINTYFSTPEYRNIKHYYDATLNDITMGVALRFYRATFAVNTCILILDDDLLPSKNI